MKSHYFLLISALYFVTLAPATLSSNDRQQSRRPASLTKEELKKLAQPEPKIKFEEILDPILIPRVPGTDNNRKVAECIKNYLKKLDWTVTTDSFEDVTPLGNKTFENIIATLNPKTPRRLMLSCHFDSKYFSNFEFDGAVDSAVPCAMLLHLVASLDKHLQEHKKSEDRDVTLQLVFFDGEEAFKEWSDIDSRYGSRHLAALWEKTLFPPDNTNSTTELHAIDLMVLLDLLGSRGPTIPNYFKRTKQWHDDLRAIEKTLRDGGMWAGKGEKKYFQDETIDEGIEDDHIPFLRRNVGILHLIPVPFPQVWHKESDKKSALNFDTIENFNMVMRLFVSRYLHLPGFSGTERTPSLPGMSKATTVKISRGILSSAAFIGALMYFTA